MAGEITLSMIADAIISAYNWLTNFLTQILQQTILKDNPSIAQDYGSAIAMLVSLTAIYILLVLVSAFKKILGIILALGWVLLIVALIMRTFSGTG